MPWSDPEQRKAYYREYYKLNKERMKLNRKTPSDEQRVAIREYAFIYRLRTIYGISKKEYDNLLEKQKNKCAICGTQEVKGKAKQMHVDHCHASKKIRGLLCMRCNTALGWFERNTKGILSYLRDDA